MSFLEDMLSSYAALGFEPGYVDLLAIVRDSPQEGYLLSDAEDISPYNLITAKSFRLSLEQNAARPNRLAGEGADPMHFSVGTLKIRASLQMPLRIPSTGFVDHAFATLWDAALLGRWGTPSTATARLAEGPTVAAGATALTVTNIADFLALPTPFALTLKPESGSEETGESVTITDVDKATRTLTLLAATAEDHTPEETRLYARIATEDAPEREPVFSLYSLREGLLAPCLVDKITVDVNAESEISVSVELAALGLHRDRQVQMRAQSAALRTAFQRKPPSSLQITPSVRVTPLSANAGDFGLAGALGHPLFAGFQGLALPSALLTGFSITIDNQLEEIYTAHSVSLDARTRQRENSLPYALAAQGGRVSGKLSYKGSIEPWALAERLAGPSSLNGGGLRVNFGTFQISLRELAWQPSTSDGNAEGDQTREVAWTLLSETFDASPYLEYPS